MVKIKDHLIVGGTVEFLGVSRDPLRRWDCSCKLKVRRHPASNVLTSFVFTVPFCCR